MTLFRLLVTSKTNRLDTCRRHILTKDPPLVRSAKQRLGNTSIGLFNPDIPVINRWQPVLCSIEIDFQLRSSRSKGFNVSWLLSSSEEMCLSSASVPGKGITIYKHLSFGNGRHIYNDYIWTIYFRVPGIDVEILIHPVQRDTDHTGQAAGISWL